MLITTIPAQSRSYAKLHVDRVTSSSFAVSATAVLKAPPGTGGPFAALVAVAHGVAAVVLVLQRGCKEEPEQDGEERRRDRPGLLRRREDSGCPDGEGMGGRAAEAPQSRCFGAGRGWGIRRGSSGHRCPPPHGKSTPVGSPKRSGRRSRWLQLQVQRGGRRRRRQHSSSLRRSDPSPNLPYKKLSQQGGSALFLSQIPLALTFSLRLWKSGCDEGEEGRERRKKIGADFFGWEKSKHI